MYVRHQAASKTKTSYPRHHARLAQIMSNPPPPPNTPLQAFNVVSDLLRRPPLPAIPHLSALLTELQTFVLPTLQQEIAAPAEFFLPALQTGFIVGERYADIRVLRSRVNDPFSPLPPLRSIQCTSPTLKNEKFLPFKEDEIYLVSSSPSSSSSSTAPLVVLLPWGGSQRKQYWPIIHHYTHDLDARVLVLNMPMVASSSLRATKILELYQRLAVEMEGVPFMTHCFSMNGAWTNARLQVCHDCVCFIFLGWSLSSSSSSS